MITDNVINKYVTLLLGNTTAMAWCTKAILRFLHIGTLLVIGSVYGLNEISRGNPTR